MTSLNHIAETVLLQNRLSQCSTVKNQRGCLQCGRHRSSRARSQEPGLLVHDLICSRRACAEARSLLRRVLSATAGTILVEIHHYHHAEHTASETRISELQAESMHRQWAELPGEPIKNSASQGHDRLPVILEEPPHVDASSKPSAGAVRIALSRRGW